LQNVLAEPLPLKVVVGAAHAASLGSCHTPRASEKSKSEPLPDLLPLIGSRRLDLLDDPRLLAEHRDVARRNRN
jgi:hypothetical protein